MTWAMHCADPACWIGGVSDCISIPQAEPTTRAKTQGPQTGRKPKDYKMGENPRTTQQGENPRTNDWYVEFDPPGANCNLPRDVSRRIGMWSSILHMLICDDMR